MFRVSNLSAVLSGIYTDAQPAPHEFFETAKDGVKRRWESVYKHLKKFVYRRLMAFMAEVQWRIVIRCHPRLLKTFGARLANPTERAQTEPFGIVLTGHCRERTSARARGEGVSAKAQRTSRNARRIGDSLETSGIASHTSWME